MQSVMLASEGALITWAENWAREQCLPISVWLTGDLGAGKTTFVRAVLRELGYQGRVKSPTFSLLESYNVGERVYHHLDLYRLNDPEELEFIGFRDLAGADAIFIEWPEKAQSLLPEPSHHIYLEYPGDSASMDPGRLLKIVT